MFSFCLTNDIQFSFLRSVHGLHRPSRSTCPFQTIRNLSLHHSTYRILSLFPVRNTISSHPLNWRYC
ncbi:hypothetical protein BIFGAL_03926 [Bifidobacterium gallicum DSM 20093 = LMG 11596]|uniref:Uncharacterized protein n=1 Tax=Bifidobacterium gallicum DSM 20093 = LMG 11596 TaxID=561180 RepID=D1NVN5_9BIFI|nr:hypothetical protein BIFGAL_03926 [Bifidobacterium gallicum DSM 20093 = LMG 11596]